LGSVPKGTCRCCERCRKWQAECRTLMIGSIPVDIV
jgi:hypothetical protein